ncbi:MAG: NAD-dependent deacetylase [bacterium]|nr:NAD-dependent deacetylase [Deltaproteobacteria bacterium]MCP4903986.1 NAD-dependent deacetylase [bacterium]
MSEETLDEAIKIARDWIAQADSLAVLTGAGISTDSGIPDFRGPKGLWTRDPDAEKMATLQVYAADPEVRKRSWKWRLDTEENKREPNAGHRALVDLERAGRLDTLVTQNVDGLHQAAGSDPARIVEIHGTLQEVECLGCGERTPMAPALARVVAGEDDPDCHGCGGMLKSATISFGQGLVAGDLERAQRAAEECDLILAIGTTLAVYPIAAMVPIAKEAGARVVILNGESTEMDAIADLVLAGSISEILPQLIPED